MISKVIFLLVAAAAVAVMADERPVYTYEPALSQESDESYESDESFESSESFESYESTEPKYSFKWAVKDDSSSNEFQHQEDRDNDDTKGSYYVQLPDGRLQKVTYYVDGDSGYIAEVTYEGEAQHPESDESSESGSYEYARR